jgi:hypothetical protein
MKTSVAVRVLRVAVFVAVAGMAVGLAYAWGVDEKPLYERIFDRYAGRIGGGALGSLLGYGFAAIFGAIGFVCGPIFGALGVVSLAVLGGLGGVGIGSFFDVAVNYDKYEFTWAVILPVLLIGLLSAWVISGAIARRLTSAHSSTDASNIS